VTIRWRRFALALALLAGLGSGLPERLAGQAAEPPVVGATQVAFVGVTVADMDRSIAFYTGVLGFEVESDVELDGPAYERLTGVFGVRLRVVRLQLGRESLELTQYLAPEGRPVPIDSRSNDRWFQHVAIVVRDLDAAYRVLREHRVRFASTGPQVLPASNPDAGGIRAFYFKDPDGHVLEIIWYPAGKGDPRWHAPTDRLFLGIDHTAIVVRNTEASLAFYRDLLGFRVVGRSRNYGSEQEHLNNVEGASLRITGLRLGAGPGVELLEYLVPTDGRPYPSDERANDMVHWHTAVAVAPGEALRRFAASGVRVTSRGVTDLPDTSLGFHEGVLARDPDGHPVLLIRP